MGRVDVYPKSHNRRQSMRMRCEQLRCFSHSIRAPPAHEQHSLSQQSARPLGHAKDRMQVSHFPPAERAASESGPLPHLTRDSTVHMVSVANKPLTGRIAIACAKVVFGNDQVLPSVQAHAVKKGDVLAVARIAAIMGAKRTADIVPLCHPGLQINNIEVDIEAVTRASPLPSEDSLVPEKGSDLDQDINPKSLKEAFMVKGLGPYGGVRICAKVGCTGQTGVEMEALTAVTAGALTVVDMCKALDKRLVIGGTKMVYKTGGKSGTYLDPNWDS